MMGLGAGCASPYLPGINAEDTCCRPLPKDPFSLIEAQGVGAAGGVIYGGSC